MPTGKLLRVSRSIGESNVCQKRSVVGDRIAEGTLTQDEAESILGTPIGESRADEPTGRRDLMQPPFAERRRILQRDAERARNHYLEDDEWLSLLGGDLLPDG